MRYSPGMTRPQTLLELAGVFLKLGLLGFGGPPAHLAMMERECVERRGWLTKQEMLDAIGAANLVPGPNSTEVAIHLGLRRGGILGLLVAGICFIFPAALFSGILAALYVRYGQMPVVEPFLAGTRPAIVAVTLATGAALARSAVKGKGLAALGLAVLGLSMVGVPELVCLLSAGLVAAYAARPKPTTVGASIALGAVALFFLQTGLSIYGGGYVLAAYLEGGLVRDLGWLTRAQVLDAVAIGQVTPGPVFSTATFAGYLLGGPAGAVVATVGIFAPAFLFVAVLGRIVRWARSNARSGAFLDGVNVAAVALILAVGLRLTPGVVGDWRAGLLFLTAALVTFVLKLNAGVTVLGAGLLGFVLFR
jgi:chromate transporter